MGITKTKVNVKKLIKAKLLPNNEFYTQYKDVEKIINEYKEDLKDKIIYCNCDLEWSNFVKYFKNNKDTIQYKEFYHTGLTNEFLFGDYAVGDFRNYDSIELLKKCDVVISNPPFTMLTEYYDLLKKHNKQFIFLAPTTFVARKIVRNDFVNQKIFINKKSADTARYFTTPDGKKVEIKTIPVTNIKKIHYNYFDSSQKCLMADCNYEYYDGTDILAITNAEKIPTDYNGLFTLSINQCWHFDFRKYELICFTNDYKHKLLINSKEQFVRLLCKKI